MNEDRAPGEAGAATGAATGAGAAAGGAAAGGAVAGGARLAGGARGALAGGVAALAVLLGMALVFGLRVGPLSEGPLSEAPTAAPEAAAGPSATEAARPVGLMATPQSGADGAAQTAAPAVGAGAAGGDPSSAAEAAGGASGASPAADAATAAATDTATASAADVARFDQLRASADGMITLAGHAEPGAKVEVLLDGQVIDTVTALAGGSFASVADAGGAVAGRLLTVRVTGADGVARDSAASVILDPGADPGDGAPAVVVDAAEGARVLAAADPGQLVIDTFTASETATGGVISGRGAPAGAMIRAYLDGAEAGLTVPRADGSWMIALPDMAPGTHPLRIDALDAL
ncbi:MAG: hypothetical protein IE922_15705 [Sphingomonadales bacterium]|nr:hypothetical protein [Sphingomonadales bacterium]